VAVSGFAKRIQRPIEKIAVNQDQITYINSPTAELLGVEAEFRKNLDFITRMLNEVTLGLNGAYIISEVPLTESQISDRSIRYGETGDSRPLYDQPTFLFNADLTWDHQATGTTITAAGGVVGRRLIAIGLAAPDVYEEPAPQFDVFVTQRLSKNFKIKLFAKNLLDPVYEATQTWPAYGTTPQETTTVVRSYTKGITFGLSATCEF
jgi:outer membrane receptor protein involved in Fe transport